MLAFFAKQRADKTNPWKQVGVFLVQIVSDNQQVLKIEYSEFDRIIASWFGVLSFKNKLILVQYSSRWHKHLWMSKFNQIHYFF